MAPIIFENEKNLEFVKDQDKKALELLLEKKNYQTIDEFEDFLQQLPTSGLSGFYLVNSTEIRKDMFTKEIDTWPVAYNYKVTRVIIGNVKYIK